MGHEEQYLYYGWIFRSLSRYFGYENTSNDNDTIIITFDDGTICDTKDEYIDKKIEFGERGHTYEFPMYFTPLKI